MSEHFFGFYILYKIPLFCLDGCYTIVAKNCIIHSSDG